MRVWSPRVRSPFQRSRRWTSSPSIMQPSASSSSSASSDYCVHLVKTSDFDSYLSGLLMPKSARRAFFALRAFNYEIAQIRDQSKNNFMTGRIRFQFWRDALQKIYEGGSIGALQDQPVIQELEICIKEHDLTHRFFERCIESRISDFGGSDFC